MNGLVDAHRSTVSRNQFTAAANDLTGVPVEEDTPILGHAATGAFVQPEVGRSNQRWTWPVPMEFSYSL